MYNKQHKEFLNCSKILTLNVVKTKNPASSQTGFQIIKNSNYPFNASAPPTISRISPVMAA